MKATPSASSAPRWALAAAVAVLAVSTSSAVDAQNAPSAGSRFSVLQGYAIDSVHKGPLAKAVVIIEGTGRNALTDAEGKYSIDSIPPGPHRIMLLHPLLDTLGLQMRTPAYPFGAGQSH